ncbi:hypothetical protein RI054_23g100060 [Pseudoscourfieldia marina]
MAATALPTLNGQPMPASYQPAINPPTAEPNATLGTKQSGIKHQETLVSVEVPKLGELSITLRRQADPEGNEEIDVEAIATEVAKALKAERNRSKEGRGVLRFQQDQVAVQLGSEVVAAKRGIYDTGCDILIITCELLSRFAEKTERWVKEKWVQFDLDGVGGINEEAWRCPSRWGLVAAAEPAGRIIGDELLTHGTFKFTNDQGTARLRANSVQRHAHHAASRHGRHPF